MTAENVYNNQQQDLNIMNFQESTSEADDNHSQYDISPIQHEDNVHGSYEIENGTAAVAEFYSENEQDDGNDSYDINNSRPLAAVQVDDNNSNYQERNMSDAANVEQGGEQCSSSHLPIAYIVLDSQHPIQPTAYVREDEPQREAVSFAIGEPFVLEAEAVRPLYLRRRVVCVLSVMFFNATLILVLLSLRNSKRKNGIEEPNLPIIGQNVTDSLPANSERRELIKSYILKHSNSSEEILDDPNTHQYEALQFLADEDIFYVSLNQELLYVQRYIEILVMITVSGKPHLILPEYVASRTDDDFIDTMHISLTEIRDEPGIIPDEISALSNLRTLLLKGNGIGGTIPSTLGVLENLVTLDLSDNIIEGTIPTEMGNLKKIKSIILEDNKLSGTLPTEFSKLDLLTLTLHKNNLIGNLTFLCDKDFQDGVELGGIIFKGFTADCLSSSLKVECGCCTQCF